MFLPARASFIADGGLLKSTEFRPENIVTAASNGGAGVGEHAERHASVPAKREGVLRTREDLLSPSPSLLV
jgi:hypothetical protein